MQHRENTPTTCWIGGPHAVRSAIQHGQVQRLVVAAPRRDRDDLIRLAQQRNIPVEQAETRTLSHWSGLDNPQGIVAQVTLPPIGNETTLDELLSRVEQPPLLLILDRITDPHNLGACLRVADAAASRCLIQVTNLARTLRRLQQQHRLVIAGLAEQAGTNLYQADLTGPLALVLGNEGCGLRRLTRTCCDTLLRLPMHGQIASLNVAVAAGVCLYEAVRQRS